MRKALGRIALLLGVVVVGAMAWYGATALFDDDSDDESSPDVECVAVASRTKALAAQRAFIKEYGDARWFGDAGIRRTSDGFVLRVTQREDRRPPELPGCQGDVPVVAVPRRSTDTG